MWELRRRRPSALHENHQRQPDRLGILIDLQILPHSVVFDDELFRPQPIDRIAAFRLYACRHRDKVGNALQTEAPHFVQRAKRQEEKGIIHIGDTLMHAARQARLAAQSAGGANETSSAVVTPVPFRSRAGPGGYQIATPDHAAISTNPSPLRMNLILIILVLLILFGGGGGFYYGGPVVGGGIGGVLLIVLIIWLLMGRR